MVKNLPSSARDMDLIPGQGTKVSHDSGQLSLTTTTEPSSSNIKKKKNFSEGPWWLRL